MQTSALFVITDEAKRRIQFLTAQYEAKIGKNAIAAILWIDSDLNNGILESQPAIGFYDDRNAVRDDIITVGGLQIVLATSERDKDQFRGQTLDFENNRFFVK